MSATGARTLCLDAPDGSAQQADHAPRSSPWSSRSILRFYTPLVLTSQLATLSGPLLNTALGRAGDPKLELAAFWIAFTVVLFLEAPCLVFQQVALSVAPRGPLRRLWLAAIGLGGLVSLAVLALGTTSLGDHLFTAWIPTTSRVGGLACHVLTWLAPLPLLVAARAVASAVAIAQHRTERVALATALRLLGMAAGIGFSIAGVSGLGTRAACAALVGGTALEAAFLSIHAWPRRRALSTGDGSEASWSAIARVGAPLAVSLMMWTFLRPVIHSILGRLSDPELAQASFGVIQPIVLVACSPLWALQDVSLVLTRRRSDLGSLLRFAAVTTVVFSAIVGLVAWTPLRAQVLRLGFDLSPELEAAVTPALGWLVLEPAVLAARAVAMGLLTRARRTGMFLVVSPLKIALTAAVGLAVAEAQPRVNGAMLAILLVIGGDLFDAVLYGLKVRRWIADDDSFTHGEAPAPGREPAPDSPRLPAADA